MKPKRIISLLLAICLVAGLMPTVAFATGSDKVIMLGTKHLQGAQADNIYFGNYFQSNSTTKEPVKWRVLSNSDGKLFLLSDQNLDVKPYNSSDTSITWEKSTIRSWLNGYAASENNSGPNYSSNNFINAAFSSGEQGAIAETYVYNATQSDGSSNPNPSYNTSGGNDTTDQIFLLSIEEANNSSYFPNGNDSRKSTNTAYVASYSGMYDVGAADFWWLRSPGDRDLLAAHVKHGGDVDDQGFSVAYTSHAVRPAFNLNLNSVLFTSAAEGGKTDSAVDSSLTTVADYADNEWKLTLLDEGRSFTASTSSATTQTQGYSNWTVEVTYSDAQTGSNEYVSAMLVDGSGSVLYYGRVANNSANGTASITIPDGLAAGNYTLKVFSEQYNGDKITDYASAFQNVDLHVHSHSWSADWSSDDTHHWHNCTAAGCPVSDNSQKDGYAEHAYDRQVATDGYLVSPATCTQAATYYKSCSCGAKGTETFTSGEALDHTPGADWKYNDSNHWKLCVSCNAKVEETAHVYDNEQDIICNDCGYVKPTYAISASPGTLDFGSEAEGYADAPAAQIVTITNIGYQSVTVNLPTSAKYIITAGKGFENGTATLASDDQATFTVQPNTGLAAGNHSETLTITGSSGASAQVSLSFTVNAVYTLMVNLNGGSGSTTDGTYPAGEVVNIDAGSRSNYRFAGWTSSNGDSFANASSAQTTFTMPAADTTITANWTYSGGSSRPSTPSTPTEPATGESGGWEEIGDEIGEAQPGETIVVDMNGTTEVPAEIFEEVAGKDVTVEFDLGDGISWTVNGQDVPTGTSFQNLNLGVEMGTSGISADVINDITGEHGSVQVTLAHDGEFGFAITLTAPLGSDNAGYWANLYYYHEDSETLTFQTSGRIEEDGSVSLRFNHASQYAIVIDDYSHAALPFADVPEGAWYHDAVSYVYTNGLMVGTGDATFSPEISTSRAMIAVTLWRMEGEPAVKGANPYTDVENGAWYTEAITWANENGIAEGYGNGCFQPETPVTREQLAAFFYRYAAYKGYDITITGSLDHFNDKDNVSEWAKDTMAWAVGYGLIGGKDNNMLDPQGEATRAEFAAMLQRFCQKG